MDARELASLLGRLGIDGLTAEQAEGVMERTNRLCGLETAPQALGPAAGGFKGEESELDLAAFVVLLTAGELSPAAHRLAHVPEETRRQMHLEAYAKACEMQVSAWPCNH